MTPGAVPSIFSFRQELPSRPSPADRRDDALARNAALSLPQFGPQTELEATKAQLEVLRSRVREQDDIIAHMRAEVALLRKQVFRFRNVKEDPDELFFLTGISLQVWNALWTFLRPTAEGVVNAKSAVKKAEGRLNCPGAGAKPSLDLEDQMLYSLMRLRLGRLEKDLADQFGVSESTVSRTVIKWLNFMYLRLGLLPIWPDWEDIDRTMPCCFREAYPSTFAILDATEFFCEVPSSLSSQSQHYSAYKSHTTTKGLVAIAPNGAFISLASCSLVLSVTVSFLYAAVLWIC